MVDDHSRLAYAEVFQGKGENARQAIAFLRRGLAFFKAHGVQVERVMSDNGSGYISKAHAIACQALGVRHTRIRPGRPRTNGKNRTLHPNAAQRMGLRPHLRQLGGTPAPARPLPRPLQLQTPTRLPRQEAPRITPDERDRELQLAARAGGQRLSTSCALQLRSSADRFGSLPKSHRPQLCAMPARGTCWLRTDQRGMLVLWQPSEPSRSLSFARAACGPLGCTAGEAFWLLSGCEPRTPARQEARRAASRR
jgi:hypothetical protein